MCPRNGSEDAASVWSIRMHDEDRPGKQRSKAEASRLRKAEEDLRAELRMWHATFEAIDDGIFILDKQHRILRCNEATGRILGLPVEEIVGRHCYELMHHSDAPIPGCPVSRMYESRLRENEVVQVGERWFNVRAEPVTDLFDNPAGAVHIVSDITWQKAREETLRQTNRALRLLSHCNAAVVKAKDEQTLLEDVCNIALDPAGYYLAWVGYAEQDDARTVRVVAHAGPSQGLLEKAHISWADNEYGRGTVGASIRSGKPCIGRDVLSNPNFAPWFEFFRRLNFGSVVSVPLQADGINFGAMAIYAAETNAFDDAEVGLLEELGKNLAHGIMALRARKERAEAVAGLERVHAELEDRVVERTARTEAGNAGPRGRRGVIAPQRTEISGVGGKRQQHHSQNGCTGQRNLFQRVRAEVFRL